MTKSCNKGNEATITHLCSKRSRSGCPPPSRRSTVSRPDASESRENGKVFLVGAGPGDIGLLTLRAKECIARADCIIYDALVNPIMLGWARDDAEIINMGKKGWSAHVSQDAITAVLLEKAQEGKLVVRLKGGDPFIFGRGGEEAQCLAEKGIPFEVVPGITSAIAVSAYSGIPLTHRDFVSQTTLLTGHPDSRIQWDTLQPDSGTLVVYMGLANLSHIAAMLMKGGWAADTPVAVVHRGTFGDQNVLTAPLDRIAEEAKKAQTKTPVLIIIGRVVSLREIIKWFERKPLFGRRILVTGSRKQSFHLAKSLEELGAVALMLPTIKVTRPRSWRELDKVLKRLAEFQYIIFPSINSVTFFFQRFLETDHDIRELQGIALGALGENTIHELTKRMLKVAFPSPVAGIDDFFKMIEDQQIKGKRILIPGCKEAKGLIANALIKNGNKVVTANTYRLVDEEIHAQELRKALVSSGVDLVIFTCPASVRNFCSVTSGEPWEKVARELTVAAVGPLTAQAATACGLTAAIIPSSYTVSSLIAKIINTMGWQESHFDEQAFFLDQANLD